MLDIDKLFLVIAAESKLYMWKNIILKSVAASKASKYGVFVVCVSPYSVQMWDNMDQKNSVLEQFWRSA